MMTSYPGYPRGNGHLRRRPQALFRCVAHALALAFALSCERPSPDCNIARQVEMKEALAYLLIWGKDRFLIFKQELSVLSIYISCRYILFVGTSTEQPMAASHSPRSEIEDPDSRFAIKYPRQVSIPRSPLVRSSRGFRPINFRVRLAQAFAAPLVMAH